MGGSLEYIAKNYIVLLSGKNVYRGFRHKKGLPVSYLVYRLFTYTLQGEEIDVWSSFGLVTGFYEL